MLPVSPDPTELHLKQSQLQLKIEELNNLESSRSLATPIVSEREIYGVIEECLKSLESLPNASLRSSLSNLLKRINSEESSPELKELKSKVQSFFLRTPLFPITKDSTIHVLEKMGVKDLSNLSRVSHYGNDMGKEALIARIKELGYEGESYDEAVKYLMSLEGSLKGLSRLEEELPVVNEILIKRICFWGEKFEGHKNKVERLTDGLERIATIPNEELIMLCANNGFYRVTDENFRKFLSLNFDTQTPLKQTESDKKMQGTALCTAAMNYDIMTMDLLLRLGVDSNSTYDKSHYHSSYNGKTALECLEILNNSHKVKYGEPDPDAIAFREQLTTILKSNSPPKP